MDYEKEEQVGYIYVNIYIIIYFLQLYINICPFGKEKVGRKKLNPAQK